MSNPQPVCVFDTNVLIDLYAGGVLRPTFLLPIVPVVPDVLIAELIEPDGRLLLDLGLARMELPGPQVERVYDLAVLHRRISSNDLFALVLAEMLGATLLTGDRNLRQVAQGRGVPVHGTLWLLDEMVSSGVIPRLLGAQALKRMLNRGSRLPGVECQKRIRQWGP